MERMMRFFAVIFVSLSLAGCATMMLGGKSGTRFNASVQKIYDAALAELDEQNMPVVSKSLTKDKAVITSEYPNGTSLQIVATSTTPQYTEANVRVGSIGDDYRAYDMMKQIEDRIK